MSLTTRYSAARAQAVRADAAQGQATQPPAVISPPDQPPAPPAPPQDAPVLAATPGAPIGINVPGVGIIVPMTRDQLQALDARGSRLSDQLQSAQGRRDRTAREIGEATSPAVQTGLEERLTFLDGRILTIEREMADNSQLRASLSANLRTSSTGDAGSGDSGRNDGPPDGLIALLVLIPISLAVARSIWRRSSRRTIVASNAQQETRFAQLEQAIDSVAVEIERVSEGQRFVTKLLREGQPIPDFPAQRGSDAVGVRSSEESGR